MANVIEVEAGGKVFEFPADTSRDVMLRALRQHFGFQEPAAQPTITQPPARPQPTTLPADFQVPVEAPPSAIPQAETTVQPPASALPAGFQLPVESPPSIAPKEEPSAVEPTEKPGMQFFTELGRGAARAATADLPSMWQSTKLLKDVGAAATVQNRLDLFNKIESGEIQSFDQLRGLDSTTSEARSYLGTTPENRAKMRERLDRELANRKDLVKASIDTIRAYQEDAKKYSPAVDRPRDIGSVTDFMNWVGSTVGSGAVQMVPLMLAAAATGGVGLGAMAVGMGTAESVNRRLQYIQDQVKNLPVEEQADKIAAYIQETGDTAIATGIASGSLDVFLGPAARLLRLRSGAIAPAATRGEAVRREARAIPGQMGSEAITGGAQEALQLGAEAKLGETPEFASRENLIKILEAAATEGVGSLGGAPINIGMAAAQAPRGEPARERVEPTIGEVAPPTGRAEPTIGELPPSEGVEPTIGEIAPSGRAEPALEAPAAPVAPTGIGMPDVEEANIQTIQADEAEAARVGVAPVIATTPPAEAVTTEETKPAPAAVVDSATSEGIPVVYPLVSALRLSDDVPQFKEDADQKGVVNKLTGKFDWRDFGAIQVWQRLNGDLEVISGRHRLDLAQRSGIERVPAQIYREADGFTAQDAAILDAELNIRDEKGTVKDYVQYFKGSGITQEEAQSRGLLDNVKGTRAFAIANFGTPELIAAHGARQLSDEAAAQIALAAPQDSRLQAVGLKVRQDGKSDEAAVNAVRAVKAIAREQNTTTDMFGFDDSLIKEAVEMAKIAERKQKELANRIAVLSKVSKNPKIAEQEGIDIKDPKAVAKRVQELKDLRAAWNNWETNPDLIDEIRQERGAFELTAETEEQRAAREAEEEAARGAEAEAAAEVERKAAADRERGEFVLTGSDRPADELEARGQEALFGAPAEPAQGAVVASQDLPDNMQARVVKTTDGYASLLFDKDSNNVVNGSVTRFTGEDSLDRATTSFNDLAAKATPAEPRKAPEPIEEVVEPVVEQAPVAQNLAKAKAAYDKALEALNAHGSAPPKPSSEKKYFGERGRAGASPEAVAKYDAQVKAYDAWKRKYNKLKKAEVDAANNLERARQAGQKGDDPTLANISNIPKNQRGAVLGARSREETIRTYQGLKTKIGALIRKLIKAEGEKRVEQVLDIQDKLKVLDEYAKDLKSEIDATKPSRRTPEDFLARITKAYADGDVSTEVFEAARAIYDKYPQLLDGLKLGIRKSPESGIIGDFVGFARLIRLYKETEGVLDPQTIRHEVAHSMEQMMDADQRAAVIDEYTKQLKRAIQQNKDNPEAQRYFDAVLKFLANPSQTTHQDAMRAMPSYDFYQYLNPSEYWAVNAEPMLKANLGNAWNRFKINMRRVFEGLKSVFGINNKYQSHKTMRALLQGTGERISSKVLVDYIGDANAEINLSNIDPNQQRRDDVDDLLNQFNRPDVPSRDTKTGLKTLLPTATRLKEIYRSARDADGRAADSLIGPLHRGIAYARNKLFFSGAGLEEADARRYGRQVVTDNDQATATLALDNMLHGGGIAVEFLTRGGIEYNPNTKRFQATVRQNNMMDVYRAEKSLKDELGVERAEKLINGYLEAKRSRSIKDEIESLTEDIEEASDRLQDANDDLQRLLTDPSATQQSINTQTRLVDRMKADIQGMKNQLDDITRINEEKVLMDDAEIDAFIGQENDFPQLRQIMDNWTAQNHRLLGLMRQVRLISDVRYERLMNIKDYVPWQRVQDDDGDIHGPAPSRSITRIPKEPKFKKGKTERPIEYIIDNMTDNLLRLTMNSLRQYAAGRIVSEYATRNERGQIKTFPKEDRDKNRFPYIIDGRRTIVEIKDPLIAEAVYGSDSIDLRMNAALEAATNFVRRAITIDPFFQIAQVIKDAPTAAVVTGVKNPAALMGRVMTSFAGTVFDTDPVAEILRANGIGGFQSIARTPEKRLKQKIGIATKSVPQATLALLDHIGDASDFAARMAAYKQTMAESGDEALALYRASNVINFNRLGSSRAIRYFIRYVNFANAYLQSVDTLVTALTGRGMRGRDTKAALAVVAGTMASLTSATLLYSFLVGGDEEYEKLDDATKARNFFIPKSITKELGLENGILIPMNTTASFLFKALPELTYQAYVSQATQTPVDAARYKKAVSEAAADALFGPEPVPSAIRPIIEIGMNRSFFTEKPLTPRGMETLEKSRQFTDATSEISKQLGEFGLLSPIEWDHLIRGTTGVAGMLVQYGSNMIGEALDVRPEATAKQAPFVGRFVAPEVGRGREALFYDLHERVRKATSTLKDLEKTGEIDKAEAFEKKNEQLIGLSAWSNRTEARLKKINEEIRLLSRGKEEGTAAQRRKEITELQREKSEMLEGIEEIRKRDAGL